MSWLHRLQQRLSITKNEALTLLSLSLFLLIGTAGRYACRQVRPVSSDYYAEFDSLLAERSAAALEPFDSSGQDGAQSGSGRPAAGRSGTDRSETDEHGIDSTGTAQIDARVGRGPRFKSPKTTPDRTTTPLHIDLNRATMHELEQLPRVGPRTAERIIAFREAYGAFRSVDELLGVTGIGPKTLEQIRPHVHVTSDSTK